LPIFELTKEIIFPDPFLAEEDTGLLAIGGDLSPERLLLAYENGIFPWYSEEMPICWYAPNPRFVLYPNKIKVSKSLRKVIDKQQFTITRNKSFANVIKACKTKPRPGQDGTWITQDMQHAYILLHKMGFAASFEVWENETLVGGLYGVELNNCFFGESMFFDKPNASKIALVHLCRNEDYQLIDCQMHTSHLEHMGAEMISFKEFIRIIKS